MAPLLSAQRSPTECWKCLLFALNTSSMTTFRIVIKVARTNVDWRATRIDWPLSDP